VQEVCDLQLRDGDLAGLSITVRYGKAGIRLGGWLHQFYAKPKITCIADSG
jgi:hypothetical protein